MSIELNEELRVLIESEIIEEIKNFDSEYDELDINNIIQQITSLIGKRLLERFKPWDCGYRIHFRRDRDLYSVKEIDQIIKDVLNIEGE